MEVQEGNGLKLSQPLEVKVYLPISIKPALRRTSRPTWIKER